MKENKTKEQSRLEYFRDLFEAAKLARADFTQSCERNMRQYLGDTEIDGSIERALTVRNITYEIIESEISSDIPVPKADAASYSELRERCAHSIERLCCAVRERLPFEEYNDADERYTYVYGSSVWYIEWDGDEDDGGVIVHLVSPLDFYPQPGVGSVRDMDHLFLTFSATRGSIMRKYGIGGEGLALCECEYEYAGDESSDAVKTVICFYRDDDGEIGRFVFSGDLILSDEPRYYKRKSLFCKSCGMPERLCKCGGALEARELEREVMTLADGRKITAPYYTPREFPIVIRRNTMGNGDFGGSDCERIRPQQQAINKVESRILQKLLRAAVTPIMPEDSTVTLTNAVFGQVIKTRPGESAESYGKLDTTPDISQDIAEADRLYDQAKRVLGISDALQGADVSSAESGYARQLKIAQSTSRLESKKRMKYLAYSELYRLIFVHYLAFADKVRRFTYRDALGNVRTSDFSRQDFLEFDGGRDAVYYDDYLFSVDLNGGSEYSRESLWEKNLQNLESGTLGDKTLPETLLRYWQSQERAHYPYARENVEYFKSAVEIKRKESETKDL